MNKSKFTIGSTFSFVLLRCVLLHSQTQHGHTNNNKFKQLYDQFADPNKYHNASGAPGVEYLQQQVADVMAIE